jgi:hypothetical protein
MFRAARENVVPPSLAPCGDAFCHLEAFCRSAPTGYGLVSYVASIDGEFDVLATPIACAMN